MSDRRRQLEARIGHVFNDPSLAELALTHRSAQRLHNERLEFLGDAVLGFTVAERLFQRFPEATEGELSRLRSRLVNKQMLADLARELGLGELLSLGAGELKSGGRNRASILADALEAVFGAIYLDAGLEECRSRILHLLSPHIPESSAMNTTKDPKTLLQELLQARSCEVPVYEVVELRGEAHDQTFVVECSVAPLPHKTRGHGKNRRLAEQEAAIEALRLLQQKD